MRKNYKSSVFQNKVLVFQILLDHLPNTSPRRQGNSHFCDSQHIILLNYCGHHLKDFQVKRASGQQYISRHLSYLRLKKIAFRTVRGTFGIHVYLEFLQCRNSNSISTLQVPKITQSVSFFLKQKKPLLKSITHLAFLDKTNIEIFGLRYIFPHLYFRIDNIPMLLSQIKLYRILFF